MLTNSVIEGTTVAVLKSTLNLTSTTFVDVLSIYLQPNCLYYISSEFATGSNGEGVQVKFSYSGTYATYSGVTDMSNSAGTSLNPRVFATAPTDVHGFSDAVDDWVSVKANIVTSAGGILVLRLAKNSVGANDTTIRPGSWLKCEKIAG